MNQSKQADMTIKSIIVLVVGLALASVGLVEAQQQAKVTKIGWLGIGGLGTQRELLGRGLRELGYVEGKKITIEDRSANNKIDRIPALADELVRLKVDVLVTPSTDAASCIFPERFFRALQVEPPIVEDLLIPFSVENKPLGTVWVVAHDDRRKFDREDERIMRTLAQFAAAAWQLWTAQATAEGAPGRARTN